MIKPPYTKKDLADIAIEIRRFLLKISLDSSQPCSKRVAAVVIRDEVFEMVDRIASTENSHKLDEII